VINTNYFLDFFVFSQYIIPDSSDIAQEELKKILQFLLVVGLIIVICDQRSVDVSFFISWYVSRKPILFLCLMNLLSTKEL
jgi:hypothetical protein